MNKYYHLNIYNHVHGWEYCNFIFDSEEAAEAKKKEFFSFGEGFEHPNQYTATIVDVSTLENANDILENYGYQYMLWVDTLGSHFEKTDIRKWDYRGCDNDISFCNFFTPKTNNTERNTSLTIIIFVPLSMKFDSEEEREKYALKCMQERMDDIFVIADKMNATLCDLVEKKK